LGPASDIEEDRLNDRRGYERRLGQRLPRKHGRTLPGARVVTTTAPSVFAMLMQMAFEKFAKAALLRAGAVTLQHAQSTHRAASQMVKIMRLQRRFLAPLGGPNVWLDVLWAVEALEGVHPTLAQGGPQLEYPWVTSADVVQWPAQHLPIAASFGNPRNNLAARVIAFASNLDAHFDDIFP
jgi:hypothetical protein